MLLTTLSNPRLAQAYVDYMATRGVSIELRPIAATETELWLRNTSQQAEAERELARFLSEPGHARYAAASWQSGTTDSPLRAQAFPYWQLVRGGGGVVTHCVSLLCVVVYLLMLLWGQEALFRWLAFPADIEQAGQVWRWFTPALLHFSWQHILFNLVMWWYVGGMVERHMGSRKLLYITLLSAFLSACAQALSSGVTFGGLSGVVYALIGYAWLYGERVPERGLQMPRAIMAVIILWFIIDYFSLLGPVGNAAHLSGLIIGLLLAYWETGRRQSA